MLGFNVFYFSWRLCFQVLFDFYRHISVKTMKHWKKFHFNNIYMAQLFFLGPPKSNSWLCHCTVVAELFYSNELRRLKLCLFSHLIRTPLPGCFLVMSNWTETWSRSKNPLDGKYTSSPWGLLGFPRMS